uniref:Fibroblast growth factor n=1 Tax=Callorhinchus milii TaxID=7868 RepID=A0A4W3JV61_CALMI
MRLSGTERTIIFSIARHNDRPGRIIWRAGCGPWAIFCPLLLYTVRPHSQFRIKNKSKDPSALSVHTPRSVAAQRRQTVNGQVLSVLLVLLADRISHNIMKGSTNPVRQRLLYCRIGIGFHLQVLPDGTVNGVHQSVLELLSVGVGTVGVRAAGTGLFLALSPRGTLYGSKTFTKDCLFREKMEENYYTTYSSHSHPRLYIALTKRGSAKNAHKARSHHPSTHFILRLVGMS